MKLFRLLPGIFVFIFSCLETRAQQAPIGSWSAHLPYSSAVSIATDGTTLYAASNLAFYTYNTETGELDAYSKVNGMSDVGMSWVGHDKRTGNTVLAYKNGNIDLFKDHSFYNLPDFKNRTINGSKNINGIYTENGLAYLSTNIGIIVLNLDKREIKETYDFTQNGTNIPVLGFSASDDFLFAVTLNGLYRISRDHPNPQVFSEWQLLDTKLLDDIAVVQNKLFVGNSDSLYVLINDTLYGIYNMEGGGHHLDEGNGNLLITKYNALLVLDPHTYQFIYYSFFENTTQAVGMPNGTYWVSDFVKGIAKGHDNPNYIKPNGPSGPYSFDIYAYDKNILVAHGAVDDKWNPLNPNTSYNRSGFSEYKDGQWVSYGGIVNYAPLDTVTDFITITKDRSDGTIYAGSYRDGLFILKTDGNNQLLKQNSPLEVSNFNGTWSVTGVTIDQNNTLWVSMFGANNELFAKTKDNNWYKYNTPYNTFFPNGTTALMIDDLDQKWYASPSGGGVIVYNDNGTLDNIADDTYRQLLVGANAGNLPNSDVYCLAKDKNGSIWIGTRNGIGIVNCPEDVISGNCEAEQPIVQYDQFAGYLFEEQIVYAIAADGANRKWVGTSNGVWLLSPTGDKIIYRFTAENSPLPSNRIQKITVDPITGDVYIGTELGLVSFRSTATDGGETNADKLITFPNPVPSGYKGTIAIKGLVENADVRITDISGQLVYRTTALGGQAVWNGMDYKGKRAQSGVYLIFASNRDGTETATGKMVFIE